MKHILELCYDLLWVISQTTMTHTNSKHLFSHSGLKKVSTRLSYHCCLRQTIKILKRFLLLKLTHTHTHLLTTSWNLACVSHRHNIRTFAQARTPSVTNTPTSSLYMHSTWPRFNSSCFLISTDPGTKWMFPSICRSLISHFPSPQHLHLWIFNIPSRPSSSSCVSSFCSGAVWSFWRWAARQEGPGVWMGTVARRTVSRVSRLCPVSPSWSSGSAWALWGSRPPPRQHSEDPFSHT